MAAVTASSSSEHARGHTAPSNGAPSYEIKVESDWAPLLDEAPPCVLAAERVGDHDVWLVDGLLSAGECTKLLDMAEGHGFGATSYPKHYRGNLRLQTTDSGLADAVWQRLQPLVPAILDFEGREWQACGLNDLWRCAKYHPGDRFQRHCDASFGRSSPEEESMLTVNLYMNEGFGGGRTRFYFGGLREPDFSVTPKAGSCLLFRQPPGRQYYHDGEELASGLKYLFRSDVMYRPRARPGTSG